MNRYFSIFAFILCFNISVKKVVAADIHAVSGGNWNNANTWNCHCLPSGADDVVIPASVTISVNEPVSFLSGRVIKVSVAGTLILRKPFHLDLDDLVVIESGGNVESSGQSDAGFYFGRIPVFVPYKNLLSGPSEITMGSLPKGMLSFQSKSAEGEVLLTWGSAPLADYDYYRLERSVDGIHFETLTDICGVSDKVNTVNCAFYDVKPLMGMSYYRLHAFDADGHESFMTINSALPKKRKLTF